MIDLEYDWRSSPLPYAQKLEAWATYLLIASQVYAYDVEHTRTDRVTYRGSEVLLVGEVEVRPYEFVPAVSLESGTQVRWDNLRADRVGRLAR